MDLKKTVSKTTIKNTDKSDSKENNSSNVKLVAFYLPQFHTIPENDEWWGKGFTEWVNVKKAKPLFPGHHQPNIPADEIGYYDLSNTKTLVKQVDLAKQYGLHGFCFYHYWFNGKLLLEKPVEEFLKNKNIDFNFCLCWANEPWTKRWDGGNNEVLQPQDYGTKEDWIKHFEYLLPFLKDKRAIKVENKPIILFYRIKDITNFNDMIDCWNDEAIKAGLDGVYVTAMLNNVTNFLNLRNKKIDAVCEFLPSFPVDKISLPQYPGEVYDYDYIWKKSINIKNMFPTQFKGAFTSWDNSPRRATNYHIYLGSTPEKYKYYLSKQIENTLNSPPEKRFIFINAWNEWAEGSYLEPDKRYGRAYLEATKEALEDVLSKIPASSEIKESLHENNAGDFNFAKHWKPDTGTLTKSSVIEENLNVPIRNVMEKILSTLLNNTTYFGIKTIKFPIDFWVYQEIIFEVKPDAIIELGVLDGGSTLAFAHILDNLGHGRVIGVDINCKNIPELVKNHPRITIINGDACASFDLIKKIIGDNKKVLIIEDSLHTYENTLNVLKTYSGLITKGSYFIVEDTCCQHVISIGPKPGPYEAVEDFIKTNDLFEIDRSKEKFFITGNPKGFLKKIK